MYQTGQSPCVKNTQKKKRKRLGKKKETLRTTKAMRTINQKAQRPTPNKKKRKRLGKKKRNYKINQNNKNNKIKKPNAQHPTPKSKRKKGKDSGKMRPSLHLVQFLPTAAPRASKQLVPIQTVRHRQLLGRRASRKNWRPTIEISASVSHLSTNRQAHHRNLLRVNFEGRASFRWPLLFPLPFVLPFCWGRCTPFISPSQPTLPF